MTDVRYVVRKCDDSDLVPLDLADAEPTHSWDVVRISDGEEVCVENCRTRQQARVAARAKRRVADYAQARA